MDSKKYSFDDLCTLTGLSSRTVRYYIQIGLLDKPIGQTKAAHYMSQHIEKLAKIKQLTESGVSLERIREILSGEDSPVSHRKKPGSIDVRSHLFIAEGIELQVSPEAAGLDPAELRNFLKAVLLAYENTKRIKND